MTATIPTPAAIGHDNADIPPQAEAAPEAVSPAVAVRGKTRQAVDRFRGALFGAGMVLAAATAPATAAETATISVKPLPTIAEVTKLDLNKVNLAEYDPFLQMVQARTGEHIFFHPRYQEKPVAPIRTREDLGSLIDGARDMPAETARAILGAETVTAANLADALERLLVPAKYPSLVSFRTVSRDGGKTFLPIFRPGTVEALPGMEADAKRILDVFAGQYQSIVVPIREGKVPAETLERWAKGIAGVAAAMPEAIMGRASLHRAAVNGYLGIQFQFRGYERAKASTGKGINHLLAKPKPLTTKTMPSGHEFEKTVYEPSGRAAVIASTSVELARLIGAREPGTEYIARLQIGADITTVKVGNLALGDGFVRVMQATGTTQEFWRDVLVTAESETAIDILWDKVKTNPRIQAMLAAETPETVKKWAPAVERGLAERTESGNALQKSLRTLQDVNRADIVGSAYGSASSASYSVAGAYYLTVYDRYKKAGRAGEINAVLPAFDDGTGVRDILDGKNNP